jgi:hypothetical protein
MPADGLDRVMLDDDAASDEDAEEHATHARDLHTGRE